MPQHPVERVVARGPVLSQRAPALVLGFAVVLLVSGCRNKACPWGWRCGLYQRDFKAKGGGFEMVAGACNVPNALLLPFQRELIHAAA